jgi:uncharacterized repeat protein (TIGR03803 family)
MHPGFKLSFSHAGRAWNRRHLIEPIIVQARLTSSPVEFMKFQKHPCLLSVLLASFSLMLAGQVSAQTFSNLYDFSVDYVFFNGNVSNIDGYGPNGSLILSGKTLYGTAAQGGSWGNGTIYAVNTQGLNFTNLHNFTATSAPTYQNGTNSDGATPSAGLLLSGNTLYGTAAYGGASGGGTVFAVHSDSTGFTNLHSFSVQATNALGRYTNSDGFYPNGALVLSGNTLYGTAYDGGANGNGSVFKVNTDGTGFTNLYSFTATSVAFPNTNSDGANPNSVILAGNLLYGTAYYGGTNGNGTIFAINTDGTGFSVLHTFTAELNNTNSDGANPAAGLTLSGTTLYGTAFWGGGSGAGTVFAIQTNGNGFTNLHSLTNSDGANPDAGVILSGGIAFGTDLNTVFTVTTNGSSFTVLATFFGMQYDPVNGTETNSAGYDPSGSLILSGTTLYGTASTGAIYGSGTLYSILLAPKLALSYFKGGQVVLTWPTGFSELTLQSATNLVSTAVWSPVVPAPVVVNGLETVTNQISGTKMFYRLSL